MKMVKLYAILPHVIKVQKPKSMKCFQVEARQQTLCGRGLQAPPTLAVSLLQHNVQSGWGEGVAAVLRLDQVPEAQREKLTGQTQR